MDFEKAFFTSISQKEKTEEFLNKLKLEKENYLISVGFSKEEIKKIEEIEENEIKETNRFQYFVPVVSLLQSGILKVEELKNKLK